MATEAKAVKAAKQTAKPKTVQQLKDEARDKAKAAAAKQKALAAYRETRGSKFPCGDLLGKDGGNVQFSVARSRDAGAATWLRLRCLKCNREAAAVAMKARRKAAKRAGRVGAKAKASKPKIVKVVKAAKPAKPEAPASAKGE